MIEAGSADISVGGDLHIETLQDLYDQDGGNWGFSVTVTGGAPTAGSVDFGSSESSMAMSNAVAGILTDMGLTLDVEAHSEIIGGVIGDALGDMVFTTGSLNVEDLKDHNTSTSKSFGLSLGKNLDKDGNVVPKSDGGSHLLNTILNGSYSDSDFRQTTLGTIGEGDIIVDGELLSDDELSELGLDNRDLDNTQITTKDKSFRTGDLNINARNIAEFRDNVRKTASNLKKIGDNISEAIAQITKRLNSSFLAQSKVGKPIDAPDFEDLASISDDDPRLLRVLEIYKNGDKKFLDGTPIGDEQLKNLTEQELTLLIKSLLVAENAISHALRFADSDSAYAKAIWDKNLAILFPSLDVNDEEAIKETLLAGKNAIDKILEDPGNRLFTTLSGRATPLVQTEYIDTVNTLIVTPDDVYYEETIQAIDIEVESHGACYCGNGYYDMIVVPSSLIASLKNSDSATQSSATNTLLHEVFHFSDGGGPGLNTNGEPEIYNDAMIKPDPSTGQLPSTNQLLNNADTFTVLTQLFNQKRLHPAPVIPPPPELKPPAFPPPDFDPPVVDW